MSGLMQLLQAVTPPPPRPASREYDGFEIRWKMFAFRPAIFVLEGVMLGVLGLYALVFLIGRTVNQSRARAA